VSGYHDVQALALFSVLGTPEADDIRARLALTGQDGSDRT
jgi:hypothetical protein